MTKSASDIRNAWQLAEGVTYLNHGSFGPSPTCVIEAREEISRRLEAQPMRFFLREMEDELHAAYRALGEFFDADHQGFIPVRNATEGMNIVAATLPLATGDEVLLTDHAYGAVLRIWQNTARKVGAKVVTAELPKDVSDADCVVEAIFCKATSQTRCLIISHITSPTALILPVAEITAEAKRRGIAVCIDGPHAPAMVDVSIRRLGCDFYTASCHKWLCAPFGSGFLYAAAKWRRKLQPINTSWGRSLGARQPEWRDDFTWQGTVDPSAFLAIPRAISFLQDFGLEQFRQQTHALVRYAADRVQEVIPQAVIPAEGVFGSMIGVDLPVMEWNPPHPAEPDPLQRELRDRFDIEIPVMWLSAPSGIRRVLRISCHLYNSEADADRLRDALEQIIRETNDVCANKS